MKAALTLSRETAHTHHQRKGAILVLAALCLVMVMAFVAFTVDVGYITYTKAEMQNAADAAALAAAMELSGTDSPQTVRTNGRSSASAVANANLGPEQSVIFNANRDVQFGRQAWNPTTQSYTFQWGDQYTPYNVVRVIASHQQQAGVGSAPGADQRLPLFFAPVLGVKNADVGASAIATFQPRDIMVVLDYSGSMSYDSRFMRMNLLGRTTIENTLTQMWRDLGSPVYGNLTATPKYASLTLGAASATIPSITVTYKGNSIDVVSPVALRTVTLEFDNGVRQTISSLTALLGSFIGTGSNAGRKITTVWVRSGGNKNRSPEKLGEKFVFDTEGLMAALEIDKVKYPYPQGSWDEYVEYATSDNTESADAGYQYKFGYMTWMNYLQEYHLSHADTPDLWKTSQQPVSILKSGVDIFIDYLISVEAEDKVGLSAYSTNDSNGAKLESGLTNNLNLIKTTSRQRQAGHYDPFTNIGAGMKLARQELVANARPKAFRMMIVMTDGVVNRPTNESTGRALVLQEAKLAADNKIKIMTISMGALADASLMQQVADMTKGIHFNVPGGSNISQYEAQMQAAFRDIAASRPLKLISGPTQ